MKTFIKWLEQFHLGRPYGPMGPDGRVYGHSTGPLQQIPGTGTWRSFDRSASSKKGDSTEEQLWNSLSPQERLIYLNGHNFMSPQELQQSGIQNLQWHELDDKAKFQINSSLEFRRKVGESK